MSGGCHSFSWSDYELGNGGSSASDMTKYNSTDGKTVLEAVDDAATVNMGSGWRMPTEAEFKILRNAVNTAWTFNYESSGVAGLVCTDKTDSSKVLFFPAAGDCSNGSVNYVGSNGLYWSSLVTTSSAIKVISGCNLFFSSGYVGWGNNNSSRCRGCAVRGVFG